MSAKIFQAQKDRVRVKLRGLDQEERDQVVIYSLFDTNEKAKAPERTNERATGH